MFALPPGRFCTTMAWPSVAAVGAETAFLDTKAFDAFLADETAKAQRYVQATKSK